jgi:hypothetical protein
MRPSQDSVGSKAHTESIGAYVGLALAGPSALPAVAAELAVAVLSVALAVGLWRGSGRPRVAILSLILGTIVTVVGLLHPWELDPPTTLDHLGFALCGVAIVLTSAFALRDGGGQ